MSVRTDELERDIFASRARLDHALSGIQGRLNAAGIVEDMLGTVRRSEAGAGLYDGALNAVRRSPVPVPLMCLGAVMLLRPRAQRKGVIHRALRDAHPDADPAGKVGPRPGASMTSEP
ncbi:DUF3618 domain-containing protein [Methylobacterium sp. J-088]|uniref:DUF3618 domain-containing protein n=1 Tax=Methylobacterium sp. J-088 TaxID=2836664 RepID=UPI001FBAF3FE|nr:DUF3618 domain-containing protein [Methylobacterium sp. J-088]MCJ2062766.1 DUF3618 domain-containing protein [Methylobacterium sp. J-088]